MEVNAGRKNRRRQRSGYQPFIVHGVEEHTQRTESSSANGRPFRSNREKDRILGIVAHDINNKLVGVIGFLDIMREEFDSLTEQEKRGYIEHCLDAGAYRAKNS